MFSLTAIRIIENSPDNVHIVVPPNYYLGAILILVSFIVGVSVARVGRRDRPEGVRPISLLCIMVSLPIGIAGIAQITSRSELVLSAAGRNMTVSHSYAGILARSSTVPTSELRYAIVETNRGAHRVVIVLNTGDVVPLSASLYQEGSYAAANAINDFLGVPLERRQR